MINNLNIALRPQGVLITWWDGDDFHDCLYPITTKDGVLLMCAKYLALLKQTETPPRHQLLLGAWIMVRNPTM